MKNLIKQYKREKLNDPELALQNFLESTFKGKKVSDIIYGLTFEYGMKDDYREDVVREVEHYLFRYALDNIDEDRTKEEITKYFYTSCRNAILDALQSNELYVKDDFHYDELSESVYHRFEREHLSDEISPDSLIVRTEKDKEYIKELMNALTKKQLDVALLLMDGYNQEEIADKLGINQSSVSRRIKRIKQVIK